jgi:NADP-dependent 3-hydroxy acid dehydrogenase YdfG
VTVPTMTSLAEKTALITGASSGVGKALAHELAARGARVLLIARDPDKLRAVADAIRWSGGTARQWALDLTDDRALENFVVEIKREFDGLNFLVHSAGVFRRGTTATAPVSDFDILYRTNVRAPFALTQALLPLIIARGGAVAFINSTAGERALAGVGQYAASKHALRALADALRLEVRAHNVRVLSVMLGRTATPMQEEVCRLEGSAYDPRRFLQPADVARAIVDALTLPANTAVENLQLQPTPA